MSAIRVGFVVCFLYFLISKRAIAKNENDYDVSTVKFAVIAFRHGQRSPDRLYPTDPHKNYTWSGGFGALTQAGKLMLYELGLKTWDRYQLMFPSDQKYSSDDLFYLRSSPINRCRVSAKSFLDGFLSSSNDPFALKSSIDVVSRRTDKLILQKASCPKYDKMRQDLYTSPSGDLKAFIENNIKLLNYLSEHTGKNITSLLRGEQVYDILSIQALHELELPEWANDVYPEKLRALAERSMAIVTENDFMKRIKGGYFITNIVVNMIEKSMNQLKPNRKLFFYSGHDSTLISVMRALNITSQTTNKPDFAASLTFELHANFYVRGDFEVRIFYRPKPESELQRISIPHCHRPCSLAAFTRAVHHLIVRDYDEECKIQTEIKPQIDSKVEPKNDSDNECDEDEPINDSQTNPKTPLPITIKASIPTTIKIALPSKTTRLASPTTNTLKLKKKPSKKNSKIVKRKK